MSERPGAVLFACNLNRVRSPMAEALVKRLYGSAIYVDSCGLSPTGEFDPFAVAVMAEIGADLSRHHAKSFHDLEPQAFDLVVPLTPEARRRAVDATRATAVVVDYWPTVDPTTARGSREQVLNVYREVRDALRDRIVERFGPPSTTGL